MNNGLEVCNHELKTAGKPYKIKLIPDKTELKANRTDICHVEVQVVDENDIIIPTGSHEITFTLQGPGKIIGVDNSDLCSNQSFQDNKRSTYFGKCLVIIESANTPGIVQLIAVAQDLRGAQQDIYSAKD